MIQEHAVHVLLGSLRQILTIRRGELCTKARQEPSLSHNNIQHMLAAYLCDRGSRPRQHCPTRQCFDSPDLVSVQYQSEECCCCVPSPSLSILRSSFTPSSARPRKQIGEHREIGKIKYFLNMKYFWSGSFNIFYGAPPFSQLNCNRELQTGTGN